MNTLVRCARFLPWARGQPAIGASPLAAEPFGVATVPAAPDSRLSAIWRDLQPAMRADEQTIVVCRANPACGSPAARLRHADRL
jgi:hypothetical protein